MTYRLEDIPIGSAVKGMFTDTPFIVTGHNERQEVIGDHLNFNNMCLLLQDFNLGSWEVVSFGSKPKPKGFAGWIQKVETQ